jgi:hypothetical protein
MRALYGAIAVIIALASAVTFPEYGLSILEIALVLACVLAACYEERWTLDKSACAVIFRHGLVFLAKTKRIPCADIDEIRVETFEKGFRKTPWTRVSIVLKEVSADTGGAADGNPDISAPLVVETMPTKKAAKLTAFAESIRGSLEAVRP